MKSRTERTLSLDTMPFANFKIEEHMLGKILGGTEGEDEVGKELVEEWR